MTELEQLQEQVARLVSERDDLKHGIERLRNQDEVHWKTRRTLLAEVERLRAVVDKAPKAWRLNKAGELVQDVPVWCGGAVWVRERSGQLYNLIATENLWDEFRGKVCDTRAAAEAAGGE